MRNPGLLVFIAGTLLLTACSNAPPSLTLSPTPPAQTVSATPTPTPTPSFSPSPSSSLAGRLFTQPDFSKIGGCGDVFVYATSPDDTIGVTIQWDQAASTAWEESGFNDSATLPKPEVQVFLVHGSRLSETYCTDIGGMGSVNGQAPAVSGTVEIAVTPDAGGFEPSSHANLTLSDVVFDIVEGTATEQWRIDQLDLRDLSVGWFAG